jgi:hypothetical protein
MTNSLKQWLSSCSLEESESFHGAVWSLHEISIIKPSVQDLRFRWHWTSCRSWPCLVRVYHCFRTTYKLHLLTWNWKHISPKQLVLEHTVTHPRTLILWGKWRMPSSGMWHSAGLLYTDVLEECFASMFRVQEIMWGSEGHLSTVQRHCMLLASAPHFSLHTVFLLPWTWQRHIPPRRWFIINSQGATSQKMAFFVFTAVKTSNPTLWENV